MIHNTPISNSWLISLSTWIVLDYSIRDFLAPSISPVFYGWTGREGSSSMVSEPRSWVQFPLATQFFAARISPSLASAGSIGTAAPEREQAAPTVMAHTQEGECWTIAYEAPSPPPYHLGFMVGLAEEGPLADSLVTDCGNQVTTCCF
jgi:hypothetical protein